jgi:hypothetical protein
MVVTPRLSGSILRRVHALLRCRWLAWGLVVVPLHYVGHLVLGRALDLCGCAGDVAAEQYERARRHGRTARQRALVTSDRPRTLAEWVGDGARIARAWDPREVANSIERPYGDRRPSIVAPWIIE